MSEDLPAVDLAMLSDITDRVFSTAREALVDGREAVGVAAYVKDNEWRGTLIYGVPVHPGRRQAAFRLLGRIARAIEADVSVSLLDTFVNRDTGIEPDEDPQAFECLVATLMVQDAFLNPVIVQPYGRGDTGELAFQEIITADFEEIGEGPVEFIQGWERGSKKPKTLAGLCYELAHNVEGLGVIAPDQEEWVKHLHKLQEGES